MKKTVFYSWQSDLPNPLNHDLIASALESAVARIYSDDSIELQPVVDRDTQNVSGSPEIVSTIFSKISEAAVFVADVSFIDTGNGTRKSPNPNVMIELGYALKALGPERIIMVFNEVAGKPNELPFDLRTRRALVYHASIETKDLKVVEKNLSESLEKDLRVAFLTLPSLLPDNSVEQLVMAIEDQKTNRHITLKKALAKLLKELNTINPPRRHLGGSKELIIKAIEDSRPLVIDFCRIANAALEMNDKELLQQLYEWFGLLFEKYHTANSYSGITNDGDYDLYRFVGYELMVCFAASFIASNKLEQLASLLDLPITVPYLRQENGPGEVYFYFASACADELESLSHTRYSQSYAGHLISERHKEAPLAELVPMNAFCAADYFLFLYDELADKGKQLAGRHKWYAWSLPYLKDTPVFLVKALRESAAKQLAKIFKQEDIKEFAQNIDKKTMEARTKCGEFALDLFLRSYRFEKIGSIKD